MPVFAEQSKRERHSSNDEGLLDLAEAAQYLGISPYTLRDWVSQRRIEFVRVGTKVVKFTKAGLDRYIASQTVAPIVKKRGSR